MNLLPASLDELEGVDHFGGLSQLAGWTVSQAVALAGGAATALLSGFNHEKDVGGGMGVGGSNARVSAGDGQVVVPEGTAAFLTSEE